MECRHKVMPTIRRDEISLTFQTPYIKLTFIRNVSKSFTRLSARRVPGTISKWESLIVYLNSDCFTCVQSFLPRIKVTKGKP